MTRKHTTRGFTLLEVLIAVLILGIIATAALPLLSSYTEKAREAREEANLVVKRKAIDRYNLEHKASLGLIYDPADNTVQTYGLDTMQGPSAQLLIPTDLNGNVMGDPVTASPGPYSYGPYLAELPPEPAALLMGAETGALAIARILGPFTKAPEWVAIEYIPDLSLPGGRRGCFRFHCIAYDTGMGRSFRRTPRTGVDLTNLPNARSVFYDFNLPNDPPVESDELLGSALGELRNRLVLGGVGTIKFPAVEALADMLTEKTRLKNRKGVLDDFEHYDAFVRSPELTKLIETDGNYRKVVDGWKPATPDVDMIRAILPTYLPVAAVSRWEKDPTNDAIFAKRVDEFGRNSWIRFEGEAKRLALMNHQVLPPNIKQFADTVKTYIWGLPEGDRNTIDDYLQSLIVTGKKIRWPAKSAEDVIIAYGDPSVPIPYETQMQQGVRNGQLAGTAVSIGNALRDYVREVVTPRVTNPIIAELGLPPGADVGADVRERLNKVIAKLDRLWNVGIIIENLAKGQKVMKVVGVRDGELTMQMQMPPMSGTSILSHLRLTLAAP